jgi:hypothetical protein
VSLTKQQIGNIRKIVSLAEKLLTNGSSQKSSSSKTGKRIRRSGVELVRFRKMLKAERKKGIPAAELARKHGVSSVYIYTLK